MKHTIRSRMLPLFLTVLMLAFMVLSAQADGTSSQPAARSKTVATLLEIKDFKFFVREDGIGTGSAPVYTAPSEDSIRLANGKAICNVDSEISVAGYVDNWLMVRYDIKDKKARVGYISPKYAKKYKANVSKMEFVSIPVKLAEKADITDNPRDNSTPYGTLPAGTEITILSKYTYTGNWWYVETNLDGKPTRGFINRGTAAIVVDGETYHGNAEMGVPVTSPENTKQIGMVTVNGTDDYAMIVRKDSDRNSAMVARVYGGDQYPCYAAVTGANGKTWYRIWVDGVWGWCSSASTSLSESN